MQVTRQNSQLVLTQDQLTFNHRVLANNLQQEPFVYIGQGNEDIKMYRGNFDIQDDVTERIPLSISQQTSTDNQIVLSLGHNGTELMTASFGLDAEGRLTIRFHATNDRWNRLWLRLHATDDEKIYGCGEQMSYFNLRGHHFPLWTSEPGIGRNKNTLTTFYADANDHAGGNYYTTNYPEPTFISSEKYYCHTDTYTYADFDFRHPGYHELQYWGIPDTITIETAPDFVTLIGKLTALLGRQQPLPLWTNNGFVAGLQGGTDRVQKLIDRFKAFNVPLAGVWCQDWEGIRITDFGKRLFWNWDADEKLYPDLKATIQKWQAEGIQYLGYINPYIANDAPMYPEADAKGYFAKSADGSTYLVDFGGFDCGVVDFTNPEAFDWFKEVIKKNMIATGLTGWMADFGEYLPTDVVLYDHSDPKVMHNKWPMLWAKCNHDAVAEAGKQDQIVYFMRAGATGTQKYTPLLWAGDQSVNWSLDDGLASTIPAALSAGMTGNGLTHSDIGGYTSRYGNIRTKELFMRWVEMAAFTPFMRSHEGNRPDTNFQVYDSDDAMNHLSRYAHLFKQLAPYRKQVMQEVTDQGLPAQRPLFLHYEDDQKAYDIQYEYLFGRDLLVAPVYQSGKTQWDVYLPDDEWIDFWTGKVYHGGQYTVDASLGTIPVFYRAGSAFADLFSKLKNVVLN
ncbi:alpha-glucosidase [Lacticaseibacillus sp. GG6-2]